MALTYVEENADRAEYILKMHLEQQVKKHLIKMIDNDLNQITILLQQVQGDKANDN